MIYLFSQFGLVVSAVYLAASLLAAYRNRGHIRMMSGAAAGLFGLACVLYLAGQDVRVGLLVTLTGLATILVPAILIHPRRLIEPRRVS